MPKLLIHVTIDDVYDTNVQFFPIMRYKILNLWSEPKRTSATCGLHCETGMGGGDSEEFFGGLGAWADKRMKELGVSWPSICIVICSFECFIHYNTFWALKSMPGVALWLVSVKQCLYQVGNQETQSNEWNNKVKVTNIVMLAGYMNCRVFMQFVMPLSLSFESSGSPSLEYRSTPNYIQGGYSISFYIIERQFPSHWIRFWYYYIIKLNRVQLLYLERARSKAGIKVCASQKEKTNLGPVIKSCQISVLYLCNSRNTNVPLESNPWRNWWFPRSSSYLIQFWIHFLGSRSYGFGYGSW